MSDATPSATRRQLLTGLTATAAGAIGARVLTSADAASAAPAVSGAVPSVLSGVRPVFSAALTAGLRYVVLDGSVLHPKVSGGTVNRYVDDTSGTGVLTPPGVLTAPIQLPVGSRLKEIDVAYISTAGTATVTLRSRPAGGVLADAATVALPNGSGARSTTAAVDIAMAETTAYLMEFSTDTPGQTIISVRLGYAPAPTGFVAITPSPRTLDTRVTGGKLAAGEERTITLPVPGNAAAAVFNLTVTDTEGAGYVACFPGATTWPGNSSINWSSANQILANTTVCAVDASGRIVIRGGVQSTHVVIDTLGYLQ
jgi:hypothetical protein